MLGLKYDRGKLGIGSQKLIKIHNLNKIFVLQQGVKIFDDNKLKVGHENYLHGVDQRAEPIKHNMSLPLLCPKSVVGDTKDGLYSIQKDGLCSIQKDGLYFI